VRNQLHLGTSLDYHRFRLSTRVKQRVIELTCVSLQILVDRLGGAEREGWYEAGDGRSLLYLLAYGNMTCAARRRCRELVRLV
jgi:hypothetical protein